MSADNAAARPKTEEPGATDERRRTALRKLGRSAAFAVPVTLGLMSIKRAVAGS